MEKKIYYSFSFIALISVIITTLLLIVLFVGYYNSEHLRSIVNINTYDKDNVPPVKNSIYYDVSVEDSIVRISKPKLQTKYLFLATLPFVAGILVFILVILYVFSSILTTKIISPIKYASENMESILSGNTVNDVEIYQEVQPFINAINIQKREIDLYIDKLKETDKFRREFTANVSHELKTPLTSINGFAEMIESGIVKGEDIQKSAGIIRKEGNRLLGLIDSIIKLSQLEDTTLKKEFTSIDLYEMSKIIIENLKFKALEKNISISLSGESSVITGNKRMLQDMIFNLVDNAIKYNKINGKVILYVSSSPNGTSIKVEDTGIGIPKEEQSRVFERFYRLDKSRSKKIEGTGLGLSMVKHTVEYHKAKMYLSSIENVGTTIEILF